ncbi:MAG: porin, partial [Campylobacter sp.]|nr:porin [Campylobacter sp.]
SLGASLHYAKSYEKTKPDGNIFEGKIYAQSGNNKLSLVHARSGEKSGWGSLNMAGDQIVFFEEGDVIYERAARTYYAMFSGKIADFNLQTLFGTTSYKLKGGDESKYRQNELTTRLTYNINKKLKIFGTYERTFKAQPRYPSLTQLSLGVTYAF